MCPEDVGIGGGTAFLFGIVISMFRFFLFEWLENFFSTEPGNGLDPIDASDLRLF